MKERQVEVAIPLGRILRATNHRMPRGLNGGPGALAVRAIHQIVIEAILAKALGVLEVFQREFRGVPEQREIDGGWLDVLDLMCQLQLSSWGRTATQASAVSDAGDPFSDIGPYWACRYDNLNIPELEQVQQSELVGVCLPGDQPRETNGFVVGRGLRGWDPIFAESINRWVFNFRSTDENLLIFDVFCH